MRVVAIVSMLFMSLASPAFAAMPHPILHFDGTEEYQAGGKTWIRYKLSVTNRANFDAALFALAPNLPPCGTNANSSRSWVDIFNGRKPYQRIYGFCALGSPQNMGSLWFAVEKGKRPPSLVFIKITDRQTNEVKPSGRVATH